MKMLLLEDDENRIEQFIKRVNELNDKKADCVTLIHAEAANDCINILKHDKFEIIFLDHDLGGKIYVDTSDENTGSEVARWINKNPDKIYDAIIITHTFNPAGAKNIINLIPNAIHVPSIWSKEIFHKVISITT